jgi:uncharacterized protein with HEPN domain
MRNEVIVQKLLSYTDKLLRYCGNVEYEQFMADSVLIEACVFNLSQMGELCSRVDREYAEAHPQIPWPEMYGLRNRIVHDYEGVNLFLVWQIISEDLPELQKELRRIVHADQSL